MGRSIWTTDVTDPVLGVLAGALAIFVGLAVGSGKLDFTWFAMGSPLLLTPAAAIAMRRSVARAVVAGMGGVALCLCIAVPLSVIREIGAMF